MKWMAIVNSRSTFKTGKGKNKLEKYLSPFAAEIHFTRYAGHALKLARRAQVKGFDGVIAVGGDGTVHEILRYLNLQQQRLVILPAGTGNSLAKDLGLNSNLIHPASLEEACFASVDLVRVSCQTSAGGRFKCYSSSTVAVGYPAQATLLANRYLKKLGGTSYAAASLISLLSRRRQSFSVRYNGGELEQKNVFGIMLSNTRHMGNFMCFPQAIPDDGCMNVIELVSPMFPQLLHNFSVLSNFHFYDPTLTRTARTVHIRLPEPGLVMIDGEIYANVRSVETEVYPRVLQVLASPAFCPSETFQ
jgi:diacylglycerol kinase (ATP)